MEWSAGYVSGSIHTSVKCALCGMVVNRVYELLAQYSVSYPRSARKVWQKQKPVPGSRNVLGMLV